MALTGLREPALKLILFGGKGGVGKTTCAASAALYCAQGAKTLLISTDPAHSLADSLGQAIGNTIRPVKGVENLSALEINAEKAMTGFKTRYEKEIKLIFDNSSYLDADDINALFTLPIPGLDEVMSFKTIVDLIEAKQFDKYIVDTAPTGHALRLLSMPGLLDEWIKVLATMRWKYHRIVDAFGGQNRANAADDFVLEMKKTVKHIAQLLKDGRRCEFVAVTIPESMVVAETERLIRSLKTYGVAVRQLVINQVVEPGLGAYSAEAKPLAAKAGLCGFCRARRKAQQKWIDVMRERLPGLRATLMSACAEEVQGLAALAEFKNKLFE